MSRASATETDISDAGDAYDDVDYERDEVEEVEYDNGDFDYYEEAEPQGLLGTPGRVIVLLSSALILMLVVGMLAWLLGERSVGSGGNGKSNVYPVTSAADADNVPGAGFETAVKVGAQAPDFTLNDVYTGKPVALSSFKGKPTWVNFWASWCPPCRAEMPAMKQRYDKYKDKGLVILGVDDAEDNATAKQFTTLNGYDWTFVLDSDGSVTTGQYFVSGLPTHVFVDKNGVIKAMQVGGISSEMMDASLAKIIGQ